MTKDPKACTAAVTRASIRRLDLVRWRGRRRVSVFHDALYFFCFVLTASSLGAGAVIGWGEPSGGSVLSISWPLATQQHKAKILTVT